MPQHFEKNRAFDKMPSTLAFFPWVYVATELNAGPLRLIPYERGTLPGDLPNTSQKDIDGVTEAYANRLGSPIQRGTIVEYGEWRSGDDDNNVIEDLMRAREFVAFCAIAKRKLFRMHGEYTNRDAFTLVVQRYAPGSPHAFAPTSRRRDGWTGHMWDAESYSFLRPLHVPSESRILLDESLLEVLLTATHLADNFFDAIVEFNSANSDSPDLPQHIEIVMLKASFERLLDIGNGVDQFARTLTELKEDVSGRQNSDSNLGEWAKRYQKAVTCLEAWAREFCDLRGASAHGTARNQKRFVWDLNSHLAFAAMLFPWIFRWKLAKAGILNLDGVVEQNLVVIDEYLRTAPFNFDFKQAMKSRTKHPWEILDSEATRRCVQKARAKKS